MLAAEPFSDEPRCVCPVIAEFLRTYNDEVDDERRQDLYPFAALVVGTRENPKVERQRANRCLDWWLEHAAPRRRFVRRIFWRLTPSSALRDMAIAHRAALWAAASRDRHAAALDLVEMLAGGAPATMDLEPEPTARETIPA